MSASSTPESGAARSFARSLRGILAGALDLVFPPACLSCHGCIETDVTTKRARDSAGLRLRSLCESCSRRVVLVDPPHCTTCGHPFFGERVENIGCSHCEKLKPVFAEGRTATLLQGPMRALVHAFKYKDARYAWSDIVTLVQANGHFRAFLDGAVLVPVPLHRRKLRERGFNQADILAQLLAAQARGATVQRLLQRVVDTPTQTFLDREQRRENLKNAFALAARATIETAQRYVLVDDVFTTGATVNACAGVLRRAGLNHVDVATLGHG